MAGFEGVGFDKPKPKTFREEAAALLQQRSIDKFAPLEPSARKDIQRGEGLWRAGVAGEGTGPEVVDLNRFSDTHSYPVPQETDVPESTGVSGPGFDSDFVSESTVVPAHTELGLPTLERMHVQAEIIRSKEFLEMAQPELPVIQDRINALNKGIATLGENDPATAQMKVELNRHERFIEEVRERRVKFDEMRKEYKKLGGNQKTPPTLH